MRYTSDSSFAEAGGWVDDADGDLSRWEYLTKTFDHDPSFQNPPCLTPELDVSATLIDTENYSVISYPTSKSTASNPPFQSAQVRHGSVAGDITKSYWEFTTPHESTQIHGLPIAPTQFPSIDVSHALMHSLQQTSMEQSSTLGMMDMCGMSHLVPPVDALDCPVDNAVDLEPIPLLPNLDRVLFPFPQLIGCETNWKVTQRLANGQLMEVLKDGRCPKFSTLLDHKVVDYGNVDVNDKKHSFGEFTAKEPIKITTLSAPCVDRTLVEPPTNQVPKMCLPLTAYNYFYRNERDYIVNGMQRSGDPIPPPIHDFSQSKMEELLHQHWCVQ
jgi:hypothetical protein